ncbi:MAG: hypothetical protein DRP83_08615 [Planctomycetota bacterium]|nr:MAG: hypothetical protein DRP83_08615 [Planctomycetota bacterium]
MDISPVFFCFVFFVIPAKLVGDYLFFVFSAKPFARRGVLWRDWRTWQDLACLSLGKSQEVKKSK